MTDNPFKEAIHEVSQDLSADIIVYFGDINQNGADEICKKVINHKRKNVLLILGTTGGDPDAAYRIARRIQKAYGTRKKYKGEDDPKFYLFLPTICKSAGTLIALGADKIYISRDAEVGPIDIQIRKHDEVGERASGLLPSEALNALASRARTTFLQQFRALRTDRALPFSTKLAAEVASNMTVGLFTPIFEQIDPLRLAEMERSQRIAAEYGKRLSVGNVKDGSLVRLLAEYPSHSFIIDSDEMEEIFNEVSEAGDKLERLSDKIEVIYKNFTESTAPLILKLDADEFGKEDEDDGQSGVEDGRPTDGPGEGSSGADRGGVPGSDREGEGKPEAPAPGNDDGGEEESGSTAEVVKMKH